MSKITFIDCEPRVPTPPRIDLDTFIGKTKIIDVESTLNLSDEFVITKCKINWKIVVSIISAITFALSFSILIVLYSLNRFH